MGIFDEAGRRFADLLEARKNNPVKPDKENQNPAQKNGHPYRTVSPEDMALLEQNRQKQEIGHDFGLAESIMNREGYQGYMGTEQVTKAFDIELSPEQIPPIPFSEQELETARELGQFLVLRVDKASDGQDLTMKKMNEILQPKFEQEDKGRVLWKPLQWVKDQIFFKQETSKLQWALTSREVIPNSTGKNYLDQTQAIADYLQNQVFPDERERPQEYTDAIEQFKQQKDEITNLMKTDWKKAVKKLSELKINQLCRQTPADAMYDTSIHFSNTGKRLLEHIYTWTSRLSSDGELVYFGEADSDGARVFSWLPYDAHDDMGVVFSRSLCPTLVKWGLLSNIFYPSAIHSAYFLNLFL